jgi:hypothetical protein
MNTALPFIQRTSETLTSETLKLPPPQALVASWEGHDLATGEGLRNRYQLFR